MGLARGSCPPSPVRMRALVEGYSGAPWYYFLWLLVGPFYQLIDFNTGWKLQSPRNFASSSGLLCASFFFSFFFFFENPQTWHKSTSMAKFLQGPHFIFRFHAMAVQHTAGSKANPVSIFIVGTKTATGFHGLS